MSMGQIFRSRLARCSADLRSECAAALDRLGASVVAEARRNLAQSPPAGLGAPPDSQFGGTSDSLSWEVDREAGRLRVTAANPQAMFREYGTRKIAARPFLRPAIEAKADETLDALRAATARVVSNQAGDP